MKAYKDDSSLDSDISAKPETEEGSILGLTRNEFLKFSMGLYFFVGIAAVWYMNEVKSRSVEQVREVRRTLSEMVKEFDPLLVSMELLRDCECDGIRRKSTTTDCSEEAGRFMKEYVNLRSRRLSSLVRISQTHGVDSSFYEAYVTLSEGAETMKGKSPDSSLCSWADEELPGIRSTLERAIIEHMPRQGR